MLLSETISFKGTIEDLKERVSKEQSFYRAEWITEHKIKFVANSSFGLATKIFNSDYAQGIYAIGDVIDEGNESIKLSLYR